MRHFYLAATVVVTISLTTLVFPASAINNGVESTSAPNVVTVIKEQANGLRFGGCSGTLLSPRVVVTAAHCVTENDTGLIATKVWVSPPGAKFKTFTEGGQEYVLLESASTLAESRAIYEQYKAISVEITSNYESSGEFVKDNDVAFLVLGKSLPLTSNIALASDEETENFIAKKSNVRIFGYGLTTFQGGMSLSPRTTTMAIAFKAISLKNSAYLSSTTSSACSGDSGGPVIVSTPTKLYLIGIISGGSISTVGPECSEKVQGNYYTLITLVTKYSNLAFAAAIAASKSIEDAQTRAEADTKLAKDAQTRAEADTKFANDAQTRAEADTKLAKDAQTRAESDAVLARDAELKAKEAQTKAESEAAANKKATITCIKGKLTKKVIAVNPKCPAGYKKK